jgi:hypothetical protein
MDIHILPAIEAARCAFKSVVDAERTRVRPSCVYLAFFEHRVD